MDSLTQIVLGASVGEAVGGRKMGNKAALWGAIAGTIPDLDVFFRFIYSPIDAMHVHRGFSHSFLFALLFAPVLAQLIFYLYKRKYDFKLLLCLSFLAIITHPLLDMFTNYGTQLFWPFDFRVSLNTISVIDPIYTLPFLIFLLITLFLKKESHLRKKINRFSLILSCTYLLTGCIIKTYIHWNVSEKYSSLNVIPNRTITVPMPLTSFFWFSLAEGKNSFYFSYESIFYPFNKKDIDTIAKNHFLLKKKGVMNNPEVLKIIKMSKNYYSVKSVGNNLFIYDLRFGNSSKISGGKQKDPVWGYLLQFKKDKLIEITPKKPDYRSGLDFKNYIRTIFSEKNYE